MLAAGCSLRRYYGLFYHRLRQPEITYFAAVTFAAFGNFHGSAHYKTVNANIFLAQIISLKFLLIITLPSRDTRERDWHSYFITLLRIAAP